MAQGVYRLDGTWCPYRSPWWQQLAGSSFQCPLGITLGVGGILLPAVQLWSLKHINPLGAGCVRNVQSGSAT